MDPTVWPEKQSEKQERVGDNLMMELVKGKEYAYELKELFLKPFGDEGLIIAEELSEKILKSFTVSIDKLSSCSSGEICRVGVGDHLIRHDSGDSRRPELKYRRGCYKRKRASESWVKVSPTMEDGYTWRKYGQKEILNSKYPRCYFRCSHKYDQGCQAIKQVQRVDEITKMYQITYFTHHTCKSTTMAPQIILDSDITTESNLLSLQEKIPQKKNSNLEPKEETQSNISSNMNSTLWQELFASGSSEPVLDVSPEIGSYYEEMASNVYTSASTSLHDFDMNIFLDFKNLYFSLS